MSGQKATEALETGTIVQAPKTVEPMIADPQGKGKQPVRNNANSQTSRVAIDSSTSDRPNVQASGSSTTPESSTVAGPGASYGTIKSKTTSSTREVDPLCTCLEGCEPGGYWDKWCCRKHFEAGQEDFNF